MEDVFWEISTLYSIHHYNNHILWLGKLGWVLVVPTGKVWKLQHQGIPMYEYEMRGYESIRQTRKER